MQTPNHDMRPICACTGQGKLRVNGRRAKLERKDGQMQREAKNEKERNGQR